MVRHVQMSWPPSLHVSCDVFGLTVQMHTPRAHKCSVHYFNMCSLNWSFVHTNALTSERNYWDIIHFWYIWLKNLRRLWKRELIFLQAVLWVPFSADSSLVANVSQSGSLVKYFLKRGDTRTGRQCARGYLATKLLGNASKEETEGKHCPIVCPVT